MQHIQIQMIWWSDHIDEILCLHSPIDIQSKRLMQQNYMLGPFYYLCCSVGGTHNTMKHHVGAHKYKTSYLFYGNNIFPQKTYTIKHFKLSWCYEENKASTHLATWFHRQMEAQNLIMAYCSIWKNQTMYKQKHRKLVKVTTSFNYHGPKDKNWKHGK
jgi:hypothetical protein